MSELKALRLSVSATQKQMADEMCLPLNDYRRLEDRGRLEASTLRAGAFAALRIAVERDGNPGWQNAELFRTFEDLLGLLERRSQPLLLQ
jgi:hypothetical protein